MKDISGQFLEVADQVEKHGSPQAIEKLMAKLRQDCAGAAGRSASQEAKAVLGQVQQALDTWKSVWPRLGQQKEFRMAVVREARAWSTRMNNLDGKSK